MPAPWWAWYVLVAFLAIDLSLLAFLGVAPAVIAMVFQCIVVLIRLMR
jgi:hypothetical protein